MISATPGREVRQELYLNTQYEKARQDVGLFLFMNIGQSDDKNKLLSVCQLQDRLRFPNRNHLYELHT